MREFGKIKTTVWASKKFKQVSIPLSKVLYLYLHSNTHGNSIGCYYVTKGYMLGDIRLSEVSIEAIDRAIKELSDLELIKWDDDEEIVYLDLPGKSRGTFDILTLSGGPNDSTKTTDLYRRVQARGRTPDAVQ